MTKDKGAGRKARANKPVEDTDFGRPSSDPSQGNERYQIRKKAQTFALLCLAGLLGWLATPASVGAASEVPQLINYSGKLSGAEGEPLPTGDYTLSFSIYDHATAGRRVWGPQIFDGNIETMGHSAKMPVVKGLFSAILGPYDIDGDPIAQAFTSSERFIEWTFEDDPPNRPRQQVFSAPFALRSPPETPVGGIIMFSGKESDLPENWKICNGQVITDKDSPYYGNKAPDLRDLFVRGATGDIGVSSKGGQDNFYHKHTFQGSSSGNTSKKIYSYSSDPYVYPDSDEETGFWLYGAGDYSVSRGYEALDVRSSDHESHSHGVSLRFVGTTTTSQIEVVPSHIKLHYIIRIK